MRLYTTFGFYILEKTRTSSLLSWLKQARAFNSVPLKSKVMCIVWSSVGLLVHKQPISSTIFLFCWSRVYWVHSVLNISSLISFWFRCRRVREYCNKNMIAGYAFYLLHTHVEDIVTGHRRRNRSGWSGYGRCTFRHQIINIHNLYPLPTNQRHTISIIQFHCCSIIARVIPESVYNLRQSEGHHWFPLLLHRARTYTYVYDRFRTHKIMNN